MSDSNSDIFYDDVKENDINELQVPGISTPPEFQDLIDRGNESLVPALSRIRYEKAYTDFKKWRQMKSNSSITSFAKCFASLLC